MKLIVQIPCFNEEETLPQTVADIPRSIQGIDTVEVLIIDDGSSDRTRQMARAAGVDHIVAHRANFGLARAFATGLDACLKLGADLIVNTDADNQYRGADIPKLLAPLLAGEADIVIGDRQTDTISEFSWFKRRLQKWGSALVRTLSGTDVRDAVSGFRAYTRDAALQVNVVSSFSYTIETVIQAGNKALAVRSVPIGTNPKTRDSRLFKSVPQFVYNQASTIFRMYGMYRPLRVFVATGGLFMLVGGIAILRFLYFVLIGEGDGHVQSVVLGGTFLLLGFFSLLMGLLADLVGNNRRLLELTLEKVRRLELSEAKRDREGEHS
jgi:glycosyltransferase involved in cell wall biosynthesis